MRKEQRSAEVRAEWQPVPIKFAAIAKGSPAVQP